MKSIIYKKINDFEYWVFIDGVLQWLIHKEPNYFPCYSGVWFTYETFKNNGDDTFTLFAPSSKKSDWDTLEDAKIFIMNEENKLI